VKIWRRSYDIPPPPLPEDSEFDFAGDRRYAGAALPRTESLKTTLDRVQPYWDGEIAPHAAKGETLLIAAHGNSLRAIVKLLYDLSGEAIVAVEVPTGNPLVVDLDSRLRPTAARYLDAARAQPLPTLA
jgi:2,3-bisphosphoglycerate-dependent phosphoglycerate mutase